VRELSIPFKGEEAAEMLQGSPSVLLDGLVKTSSCVYLVKRDA
jgi:hypothetical protein